MKKTLLVASIATSVALGSMAQGIVNANNSGQGVLAMIQDTTGVINHGAAVVVGTPATAAGFPAGAGPGQVTYELFAAPASESLTALQIAAGPVLMTIKNSAGSAAGAQGTMALGAAFTLPTQAGFDGSGLVDFVVEGLATVGTTPYMGLSTIGAIQPITLTAANGGTPAPFIWGIGSGSGISSLVLTPVPEPTTIAIGGLGAAALMFLRRRK
jgi:hypothetical protein